MISKSQKIKLDDVGKIITGKTPSKNNPEYWGSDFMFLTPSDIKTNNKFINKTNRYLSNIGRDKMNSIFLP